ncbi:zinc transporter ZIP10-like [Mizuhopecten yessoensis]|uniref:zinc transporter ZIP10-like n=1 Tax=Mizuhopecten yessoensis TaxID=6573 RepID=UPI000B45E8AB|nr:zinc transporter ZIP10-like [Mizuhopecten yessoensis]
MTPILVWGYSTIAVVVISLVGLLGVAIVPIMQKVFYNHLLLFLVALAVGALAGDALLHLLPHVSNNINISGQGVGGFLLVWHHFPSYFPSGSFPLVGLASKAKVFFVGYKDKLSHDIVQVPQKNGYQILSFEPFLWNKESSLELTKEVVIEGVVESSPPILGLKICFILFLALTNFAESSHKNCSRDHEDHNDKDKQFDMVDQENPSSVLSHSHHHHGHSHILPTSVASIAWMIILGDGIHKVCDGLAIGAAFSNSITGGFTTSVAVFCHELPHEIGDFAVLLRAGMTVKQAVMYNCVSSILAFVGMIIGVAIGNFGDSITWVYVSVAGMFLYIALVDMLPELTAMDTRQGEHPFSHLLIQLSGMILGSTIMLIIALYEKNLMHILEPV